jgi:hypothetical protein
LDEPRHGSGPNESRQPSSADALNRLAAMAYRELKAKGFDERAARIMAERSRSMALNHAFTLADAWLAIERYGGRVELPEQRRQHDQEEPPKVALARQAVQLKKDNPTWTWPRIVNHIGLVSAIEDEGRSRQPEKAALEWLRRWRQRLPKLDE